MIVVLDERHINLVEAEVREDGVGVGYQEDEAQDDGNHHVLAKAARPYMVCVYTHAHRHADTHLGRGKRITTRRGLEPTITYIYIYIYMYTHKHYR